MWEKRGEWEKRKNENKNVRDSEEIIEGGKSEVEQGFKKKKREREDNIKVIKKRKRRGENGRGVKEKKGRQFQW